MVYVFGTKGEVEILKTKGSAHTDLTGFHQIERTYPDQTITDNFRVVRKLGSTEDCEGNCYDWYEIDRHFRTIDKTGPVAEKAAEDAANLEAAVCELDVAMDTRITDIEAALCEIDSTLNG